MFIKKAQTATEYLIILAVVIIIALLVVGTLGGIPTLGSGTSASISKLALSSGAIGISEYALTGDLLKLRLQNNNPYTVSVDSISIADENCPLGTSAFRLRAGESKTVSLICDHLTDEIGAIFISLFNSFINYLYYYFYFI